MITELQRDERNIASYLQLLLEFNGLRKSKRGKTLMEVSGYPHYENVASNILAFYFDPSAEHGLQDLLIAAFLQMAGQDEVPALDNVKVIREGITEDGKRIDLIIDCDAFTIGIENKIYHWLANDLVQYAKAIDARGENKGIVIKAVLGLKPEQLCGGFFYYSYGKLWEKVRGKLGFYIAHADPKWVTYLMDFMETTTTLGGDNMEVQNLDKFFIEHDDLIEQMLFERNAFLTRLNQRVSELYSLIEEQINTIEYMKPSLWIYNKSAVVLDYIFEDDYKISFDLYIGLSGWKLLLFGRNPKSKTYLNKLMDSPAFKKQCANFSMVNYRYVIQTWPLDSELDMIKEELCGWMNVLITAVKSE